MFPLRQTSGLCPSKQADIPHLPSYLETFPPSKDAALNVVPNTNRYAHETRQRIFMSERFTSSPAQAYSLDSVATSPSNSPSSISSSSELSSSLLSATFSSNPGSAFHSL